MQTIVSPSPMPLTRGRLGGHPRLTLSGPVLLASGANALFESDDQAATFHSVSLPAGSDGLVVAPSDSRRRLTGGSSLHISDDSGSSWRLAQASPPGPGPYMPLAISLSDKDVWFASAHGRLLRTRDGGNSWRELAGISADAGTLVVPTGRPGEFVVAAGEQIYELLDNGQQIRPRAGLPGSARALEMAVAATDPSIALLARGSDGKDYIDVGGGWQASVPLSGAIAAIPGRWIVVGDASESAVSGQIEASTDVGKTWSEGHGLPDGQSVDAIVAGPGASAAFAYTYAGSVFTSVDGVTWTRTQGSLGS